MTTERLKGHARGIRIAALLGLVFTATAIVTTSIVLSDATSRSGEFWARIAWSVILISLLWLYIGGYFALVASPARELKGIGGVLPGFGIILFLYVGLSFILMGLSLYFPALTPLSVASNIVRASGLMVIGIFVYLSWAAGVVDTEPVSEQVVSPESLIRLLQEQEDALALLSRNSRDAVNLPTEDVVATVQNLKRLRERIDYSLPHVGRIGRNEKYVAFSNSVLLLCAQCKALVPGEIDRDNVTNIAMHAANLGSEVRGLSHEVRRA